MENPYEICATQRIELIRTPRSRWKKQVGRCVTYVTQGDISPAGHHPYYTGVLESWDRGQVTFKFTTWIEPSLNKTYGRETRVLKSKDVLEILSSPMSPEHQRQHFELETTVKTE